MTKALVLNATYSPICVVPLKRAVVLVLTEKAEILHEADGEFRSPSMSMPIPSVVRLKTFVKIPYKTTARLTNRGVLIRDNYSCQYCGKKADTVDHIMPRSRGGKHTWQNCVAADKACNGKKANRTPEEAGMKLLSKPFAPKHIAHLVIATTDRAWLPYLEGAVQPEFA